MKIRIIPRPLCIHETHVLRSCLIQRIDGGQLVDEQVLWYELDASCLMPPSDDCDSYLLAVIMDAMQENRQIEVRGSVSLALLSNLFEYQAAWNKWLPTLYHVVNILPDHIRIGCDQHKGAICAFSGGLDGAFSVWRHSQGKCGYRTQEISRCVLVQGFDIDLENVTAFETVRERSESLLRTISLDLVVVKTNHRLISRVSWEHSFAAALVGALSNYKRVAGTCIIGSSEPYDSIVIPWGSNSITDHLLSSSDFAVIHDGASHSRTEKANEVACWAAGSEGLKVCWENQEQTDNCGTCEKCVRTKLNFLAAGRKIPASLPTSSDLLEDISNVKINNAAVQAEWQSIFQYASESGIDAPWVVALEALLKSHESSG